MTAIPAEQVYPWRTLPLVRQAPAAFLPDYQSDMHNDTRTPVRQDVVRMLSRYVRMEYFGVRSAAGKIAIDETRVPKRQRPQAVDLDGLTKPETLGVLFAAAIRQAVYAQTEKRTDVVYADGPDAGKPMRCTAPRAAVARMVPVKSHFGGDAAAATDKNPQLWKATVATKLGRIPKAEQDALILAALIRMKLVVLRNQLQAARSDVQRLKSGGKNARDLRNRAEQRVAELRERETAESNLLKSTVHTNEYHNGLDRLWLVCTATRELEAYLFGEAE